MTLSTDTVDVTGGEATVVIRAHVTDDTGVDMVQGNTPSELVSGGPRDGWWESTVTVPRWAPPGSLDVFVNARDRTNRENERIWPNAITIVDGNPDTELPTLTDVSITPTTLDVRSVSAHVTMTATISDAVS